MSSTIPDVQTRIGKAWGALNNLDVIWNSSLPNSLKRNFFHDDAVESVLVYGATSWTLTKSLTKTLDGCYTRMLRAALNVSWKHYLTNKELYGPLTPISTTIRDRRLRFAGHCYRAKEELASDVILWQPNHGERSRGRPAKTYVDQLVEDIGCNSENLPALMINRDSWKECVKCRASSTR